MRIAHLERPNFALRALPGLIGGPTLGIRIVLTGPEGTKTIDSPPLLMERQAVPEDRGLADRVKPAKHGVKQAFLANHLTLDRLPEGIEP